MPATTRPNPRYSHHSAHVTPRSHNQSTYSIPKSSFSYGNQSAFNESAFGRSAGSSLLYTPPKSKRIPSRNSWHHAFAIPIECGKRAMHLDPGLSLWTDPHCIKLRTSNNRRIVCGGLLWDIYVHPNQGEGNDEFAVSVFPVKSSTDDALPENYKLNYTVTTTLCSKDTARHTDDDQKSISKFDHRWSKEIEDVVYDDSPGSGRQHQIEWKHQMQRLPFSTMDLIRYNCSEDGQFFDLDISIKTEYIKTRPKRSVLFGVMGAIVLQSEEQLEAARRENARLEEHKDKHTVSLQTQLAAANKLNANLTANMTEFAGFHRQYTEGMEAVKQELHSLATRDQRESVRKEKEISKLQDELVEKQEDIQRLTQQMAKLKEQISTGDQYSNLYQLLQSMMQSQQITQQFTARNLQQHNLQQRMLFAQQQQQAMHKVDAAQQQQQSNAAQHTLNAFEAPQTVPVAVPTQNLLSAVGAQAVRPPLPSQFQQFPASPQQNVSAQRSAMAGGPAVGGSPQSMNTNITNVSTAAVGGAAAYQPRVVNQPNFASYQTMNVAATPPKEPSTLHALTEDVQALNVSTTTIPALEANEHAAERTDREELKQETLSETAGGVTVKVESANTVGTATSAVLSQNHAATVPATANMTEQTPQAPTPAISMEIDDVNESSEFEHDPVRGQRWDSELNKWRGRGRGRVALYWNRERNLGKLVFVDTKHSKVRLLQWIDGNTECALCDGTTDAVEWFGADYTMDLTTPMVGKWKLHFLENAGAAQHFMRTFNEHIAAHNANERALAGDDRETANDSTGAADGGQCQDDNKQFAFDHNDEAPVEQSFTNQSSGGFGGDFSATAWSNSFGVANDGGISRDEKESEAAGAGPESNSFGDINWSFGTESAAANEAAAPASSEKVAPPQNEDEDNMRECTFKPIVSLEEQEVATGHENEELLAQCDYLKLYRFGPDVSGEMGWKNRGTRSSVSFYKDSADGTVRLISREQITNKLRMNQRVYPEEKAEFTQKTSKMLQWTAYDATIAKEEEDPNKGLSSWLIKFSGEGEARQFAEHFRDAMKRNANLNDGGGAASDEQRSVTPEVAEQPESLGDSKTDGLFAAAAAAANDAAGDEMDDAERYKGWEQHEIDQDKATRAKAIKDAKSAKLFASDNPDDAPQSTSWTMDAFGGGFGGGDNAAADAFSGINFGEQRGVDLEAESVLNRIGTDPTISFGVDPSNADGQDFSNVTTRGDGDEKDTVGALGANGFTFCSNDGKKEESSSWSFGSAAAAEPTEQSSWNLGGDSGDKKGAESGGWGDIGGGFSSVKPTDGFGNASWGTNNEDGGGGGWGSFGDANNFNLESLATTEQPAAATTTTAVAAAKPLANDDEENMAECTFKPIIDLKEVEVAAGTEDDQQLDSFDVSRLYRWGKDVTGDAGWKNRATSTTVEFYQQPNRGRIRVICREAVTQKLRMNHFLPNAETAKALLRGEKFVQWAGFDATILAEDEDDNGGFCMFNCRFGDADTAKKFHQMLVESIENNEKLVDKQ